jgi:competence protein ComEC
MRARPRWRDPDPDGVAILGAVVAGTLAGRAVAPGVAVPAALGALAVAVPAALVLLATRPRLRDAARAGLLALVLLAGTATAVTAGRAAAVQRAVLPALAGEGGTVTVGGTVAAEPRRLRSGGLGITLAVDRVTTATGSWRTRERAGLVLPASTPAGTPGLGDRLVVRGGVVPAARGDPLGRVPLAELHRVDLVSRSPARAPALTATERVRAAARRVALATLPADRAGLLAGLALGDTSIMAGDVEAAFRAAGLTHLVAVSGANVW